ncbi:24813_t:CDS:2, partial [Cetraspora pellucida]
SGKLKHLQAVQAIVKLKAIKNCQPFEITNAVKEYATKTLDLEDCIKELKCELDIHKAVAFLKNQKYKVEHFKITSQSTEGLVFIYPNQIDNLEQYG